MDIKEKAVQQAIKILEATGARYHIITADNQEFGGPVKVLPLRRASILPNFRDKLDALKVGDSCLVECSKGDRDNYQASIANYCRVLHGAGNYMTTRVSGGIEVLILATNKADQSQHVESNSVVPFTQVK